MGEMSLADANYIKSELESILSKNGNDKLISLDVGVAINMCLLLHPAPRRLVKMVVDRRRVEDLTFLSSP